MIVTAGKYKGRKIIAPDEKITRPTLSKIRECVFSTLFSMTDFEGKSFLDVFAGSGIMGFEALSRGFENLVSLEKNPKIASVLKKNAQTLNIAPNIIIGDSLKLLKKLNDKFDVIYLDPPYESRIYEDALKKISENQLVYEKSIVILEHNCDINWEKEKFSLIKQKIFADKLITFLKPEFE